MLSCLAGRGPCSDILKLVLEIFWAAARWRELKAMQSPQCHEITGKMSCSALALAGKRTLQCDDTQKHGQTNP